MSLTLLIVIAYDTIKGNCRRWNLNNILDINTLSPTLCLFKTYSTKIWSPNREIIKRVPVPLHSLLERSIFLNTIAEILIFNNSSWLGVHEYFYSCASDWDTMQLRQKTEVWVRFWYTILTKINTCFGLIHRNLIVVDQVHYV